MKKYARPICEILGLPDWHRVRGKYFLQEDSPNEIAAHIGNLVATTVQMRNQTDRRVKGKAMTTDAQKSSRRLGWLPGASAFVAFIACNGVFALAAFLSFFGITIAVNPHVQAGVISLFSLLTFGFVLMAYRQSHVRGPLILSVIGAIVLVGSMYVYFNKIVESAGLLALIVSAVWSWRAGKSRTHSSGAR